MNKKILIVGIGGVGGYFGGLLAQSFHKKDDISVFFMARGENLKAIQQNGLLVTTPHTQFYAYPDKVSDNPPDFGKVDYIILCTKSYDIKETANKLRSCVKDDTVLLPLLNGVDNAGTIRTIYPNNLVADGCAYIISRLIAAGQVQNMGDNQSIIFGIQNTDDPRLAFLDTAFKEAGISALLTKNISTHIWEKFIFISATATVTSYYNKNFGEINQCEECKNDLRQLIDECYILARHKNIVLPADLKEKVWDKFSNLLPQATTSMHADYLSGKKQTEVRSLTGYIVEQAERYSLYLPKYQEMYHHLIKNHS